MKNNIGVWFKHEHTHIGEMLKFLSGLIEMFSTHKISIFSSLSLFSGVVNVVSVVRKVPVNQAAEVNEKRKIFYPKWIINAERYNCSGLQTEN